MRCDHTCIVSSHVLGHSLSARPQKHSLTLKGHRTSVSLEAEFWTAFRQIAKADGKAVNALASEIDASRSPDVGLASAIRVFVLQHFRDR